MDQCFSRNAGVEDTIAPDHSFFDHTNQVNITSGSFGGILTGSSRSNYQERA